MSKSEIERKIKSNFPFFENQRNIKIPNGINWNIEGNIVTMSLSSNIVCENMQKNSSAFEGWALVIKRWGEYEKIIIRWDKPDSTTNSHYQRFLFRIKQFRQDFSEWFIIDNNCEIFLNDLKIIETGEYFLNLPSKDRGKDLSNQKEVSITEAKLENRFVYKDLKESLKEISNADELYSQLPVGVFANKISKDTSIFTYGKSAIDIWGYSKANELLVFELKTTRNITIGIISELYFYTCVLHNLQKQKFKHLCLGKYTYLSKIPRTKNIKAYFLTPELHPLIDRKLFEILNSVVPNEIIYQHIKFNPNDEFKLTVIQ